MGGAYQQQNLWKKRCQWLVGFKRRCLFLPHLAQLAPIIKFQVVHAHHYCKGWNYYTVWPGPIWTKLKTSWQITVDPNNLKIRSCWTVGLLVWQFFYYSWLVFWEFFDSFLMNYLERFFWWEIFFGFFDMFQNCFNYANFGSKYLRLLRSWC